MNMKKICFLQFDSGRQNLFLPVFWFGLKRYYELNGKHSKEWEWIRPVVDYSDYTPRDVCDEAVRHNADVYAFSGYMWNWNLILTVSKKIRESCPNSIIVLGGPNQGTTYTDPINWFKKYPQFDATCKPTEYGEFFITDLLDCVYEGNVDWNKIRNSYHRKGHGPIGDKRSFVFPEDAIISHLDIAVEYAALAKLKKRQSMVLYETTRGCPYGCTYCEWGGGTNSKIITKSIETIKKELDCLAILDISGIYLCDANFGILKRDEEISKLFVEYKKVGLKYVTIMGLAKTSTEKRKKVLEPLFEADLVTRYQMSVQTTNQKSLLAIDRTDCTVEENLELGAYFLEKYNADVTVELILGLPETTLDDYYRELDYFYTDYSATKYFITVLPDSPYADPNYIKKWGLELVPVGSESELTDDEYLPIYDESMVKEPFTFITVSSNTFSKEDWREMAFMIDMEVIFNNRIMLKPFTDYLIKNKDYKAGYVLKKVFKAISSVDSFFEPIEKYFQDILEGRYALRDYKKIEGKHVFRFYLEKWIENRKLIFESIRKEFENDLDEISLDCIDYVENTTLREDESIIWISKWDWKHWEENEQIGTEPEKISVKIITEAKPINWYPTMRRTDHSKNFNLPEYDDQVINKKLKRA